MNLFIPKLDLEVTLAANWDFTLYPERRNSSLWKLLGLDWTDYCKEWKWIPAAERTSQGAPWYRTLREERTIKFLLLKGTVLKIERIFIRRGAAKFDSVTFSYRADKKRYRFWAKLEDVNKMEIE